MKKVIKTKNVLSAFNVLNTAKYGSMDDADKIKVWKIARALKPIATQFEEDSKDAAEKMKPEIEGGFDDMLAKAQEYERLRRDPQADMSKSPIGAAQYDTFVAEFKKYNSLVEKSVKDFAEKEVELEFEPLTEDAFGKLMASNDWTMNQVCALAEIITA